MRLVAWNCSMALHKKFDALLSLQPDIAVISECAQPEILLDKLEEPHPHEKIIWIGSNHHKGLAVLAFNDYEISLREAYDPALRFIAPVQVVGPTSFELLGVWAQNNNDNIRRKDQPGPLRNALDLYENMLVSNSAVVAGDFNNNIFWDRPGWPMNHADAVDVMKNLDLVSAYHEIHQEAQGAESIPTHYWRDRKVDGPTYHIDYIFLSRILADSITNFDVGDFETWCGSGLSDHVPLVIEILD